MTILKGNRRYKEQIHCAICSLPLPLLIAFPIVLWKLLSLKRYKKGDRVASGVEGWSEGREMRSRAWPRMGLLKQRSKRSPTLSGKKV